MSIYRLCKENPETESERLFSRHVNSHVLMGTAKLCGCEVNEICLLVISIFKTIQIQMF
jgi:hypothetical protein